MGVGKRLSMSLSLSRAALSRILVLATVVLAIIAIQAAWSGTPDMRFWFWLGACALGELLWVRVPVGGATVSMALACNFATMLLLPPGQAMLAIAVSTLVVEAVVMRKPPLRYFFNAAQSALAAGAGMLAMYLASGGRIPPLHTLDLQLLGAVALAAATYALINTGAVSIAISIDRRRRLLAVWRANFGAPRTLLSSLAHYSLGALLAAIDVLAGPEGMMLIALPLFVIHACCVIVMLRSRPVAAAEPDDEERRAA